MWSCDCRERYEVSEHEGDVIFVFVRFELKLIKWILSND